MRAIMGGGSREKRSTKKLGNGFQVIGLEKKRMQRPFKSARERSASGRGKVGAGESRGDGRRARRGGDLVVRERTK